MTRSRATELQTEAPPSSPGTRWRRLIFLAVGTLLLGWYVEGLDFDAVGGTLERLSLAAVAGIVGLNALPGIFKFARWRNLLEHRGHGTVGFEGYLAVNASFYLGLVTPGTVGELSRAFVAESPQAGRATAVVAFEKLTDFVVLGLLAVTSVAVQFTGGTTSWLVVGGAALATVAAYWVFLRQDRLLTAPLKFLLERAVSDERRRSLRDAYWEFYELVEDGRLTVYSLFVSTALWGVTLLQMHLIFEGFGLEVPLKTTALTLFLPYLLGVVSLIPLGLGVFELTMSRVADLVVGGGAAAGANVGPLAFRILVTVPLVLGGYLCHLALALRRERPR